MKSIKQLSIIGPTASGKTALSIKVAQKLNAYIFSLDSLSIYKQIDIVSAKPSVEERMGIYHFGINYIYPNEEFSVGTYIKLYHQVYQKCIEDSKNLVIVGGTSFYLKMLIDGVSPMPTISTQTQEQTKQYLQDLNSSYDLLYSLDKEYMSSIKPTDSYRIEKALHIYLQSNQTPTDYFSQHPPTPTIQNSMPIYQITIDREILRKRIALRTEMMIKDGLIDEVCKLEKIYTRRPNAMGAIGIKETLAYLDGVYNKDMLIEKITTNTARLAKRQTTFNSSQFNGVIRGCTEDIEKMLLM